MYKRKVFSCSLSWSRACFLYFFLFFLIAFLVESVFSFFFPFFLDRFLDRKRVFLFLYVLVFFYKFPPQMKLMYARNLKNAELQSETVKTGPK